MAAADASPAEVKAVYEAARKEVVHALDKKRAVDKQLAQIEQQLYNFEGSYLTETTSHYGGNIVTGFDNYLKPQNTTRKRHEIGDKERIFSMSSATYETVVGWNEQDDSDAGGGRAQFSGLATIAVPPASRTELTAAQNKKQRDKEYQRRKRASMRASTAETGSGDDAESVTAQPTRRNKRARTDD